MCLFLIGHLLGNLLLYVSKEAFNNYADLLTSNPVLLYSVEFIMLAALTIHIVTAVKLTKENSAAKPVKYAMKASGGSRTWASSHMIHSGMVTLLFLFIHLWTFKFGGWSNDSDSTLTLYDLVVLRFSSFYYSAGYLIAMVMISNHLHHAVSSACITLGVANSELLQLIKKISLGYAVIIGGGFSTFPIYFYLTSL